MSSGPIDLRYWLSRDSGSADGDGTAYGNGSGRGRADGNGWGDDDGTCRGCGYGTGVCDVTGYGNSYTCYGMRNEGRAVGEGDDRGKSGTNV